MEVGCRDYAAVKDTCCLSAVGVTLALRGVQAAVGVGAYRAPIHRITLVQYRIHTHTHECSANLHRTIQQTEQHRLSIDTSN